MEGTKNKGQYKSAQRMTMYDYCKDQIISTHYCRKSVKGSQTYFEGEHIHICGKVACNHCKSKWGNAEDCMNRCKEHANV